ncbi:hypothetical protein B0O80DRAFT_447151 [Mortierella sp. GBAus27b]|nr:hypothetical protein BGX31_001046 [Mortierella sp. GBA43]KAI8356321.1 hypothetical protein B0O80DRAFT_447151 [Mortierella sp. GBAus27b]
MSHHNQHPLLIPEIILRISLHVSAKDAVACTRVCKAWNYAFSPVVWNTVDFRVQKKFINLDPVVISKYGHHIRTVKRISQEQQLEALHHSSICKLQGLRIAMSTETPFQVFCYDLLRRNAASIAELELKVSVSPSLPFPFDAISPTVNGQKTSNLFSLEIDGFSMTRSGFSWLLQMCPALRSLKMLRITLYSDTSCSDPYLHTGLINLESSLDQIFQSGPGPSLLAHFPKLEAIEVWPSDSAITVSYGEMKRQVARWNPGLTDISIRDLPAIATTGLLTQVFRSITHICLISLSSSVVMGILAHQGTLVSITKYVHDGYCEQGSVPELTGVPAVSGWEIQLIPQTCSRLTNIYIPNLEMDMDEIEKTPWSCIRLRSLYIRIRGLNTKGKIDRAIKLWIEHRNGMREAENIMEVGEAMEVDSSYNVATLLNEDSIEARVARHLGKFKDLKELWLGHKITYFP